jgi:pSer/pThr/pTyr-binding forkhead associated (FHA) protein
MAHLQYGSQQFPLRLGAQRVGGDPIAEIALPGAGAVAVVTLAADGSALIARGAAEDEVRVNGVTLGVEPSPLMHGDRVEVGVLELRYSDQAQDGSTQFVSAAAVAQAVSQRKAGPGKPTTATGGRLVSLVDGREYPIGAEGVIVGRDASADIVVPVTEVSRRHARIVPGGDGYTLSDLSTNGVWINGERVIGERVLGRADVIRIGPEEFRFYADVARAAAAAPAAMPVAVAPPAPVAPVAAPVAPVAAAAAPLRPLLATLIVQNVGPSQGRTFDIRSPLTHIGRGAHNDVVIDDGSVSDSHAKLQQRDDGWVLVDMGSTNGTFVGGRRVETEHRLEGSPDLRFGDVKVLFQPVVAASDPGKGTRAMGAAAIAEARRAAVARKSVASPVPSAPAAGTGRWSPLLVIAVAVALVAIVGFFLMQGR